MLINVLHVFWTASTPGSAREPKIKNTSSENEQRKRQTVLLQLDAFLKCNWLTKTAHGVIKAKMNR